jgi:hypothetical protein
MHGRLFLRSTALGHHTPKTPAPSALPDTTPLRITSENAIFDGIRIGSLHGEADWFAVHRAVQCSLRRLR